MVRRLYANLGKICKKVVQEHIKRRAGLMQTDALVLCCTMLHPRCCTVAILHPSFRNFWRKLSNTHHVKIYTEIRIAPQIKTFEKLKLVATIRILSSVFRCLEGSITVCFHLCCCAQIVKKCCTSQLTQIVKKCCTSQLTHKVGTVWGSALLHSVSL